MSITLRRRLERLESYITPQRKIADRLREARVRMDAGGRNQPISEERILALEECRNPTAQRLARAYRRNAS